MKNVILSLCLILSFTYIHAQKKGIIIYDTVHTVNDNKELELYKMLYQTAKEDSRANYSILFTIIAIVVGFIIFILGSQAFFNYRLNKRDLDNLKSELQANFTLTINNLENKNLLSQIAIENKINDKNTDTNEKIEKTIRDRFDIAFSSLNHLYGHFYASKGDLNLALIRHLYACEQAANTGVNLNYSLKDVLQSLSTVTEIYKSNLDFFSELKKKIEDKYGEKYNSELDELQKEISKKQIIASDTPNN